MGSNSQEHRLKTFFPEAVQGKVHACFKLNANTKDMVDLPIKDRRGKPIIWNSPPQHSPGLFLCLKNGNLESLPAKIVGNCEAGRS